MNSEIQAAIKQAYNYMMQKTTQTKIAIYQNEKIFFNSQGLEWGSSWAPRSTKFDPGPHNHQIQCMPVYLHAHIYKCAQLRQLTRYALLFNHSTFIQRPTEWLSCAPTHQLHTWWPAFPRTGGMPQYDPSQQCYMVSQEWSWYKTKSCRTLPVAD